MSDDRLLLAEETLRILNQTFPDSQCSLISDTPERLAVRGILSAQCTDTRVNQTCEELFDKYPEASALASAPEEKIAEIIRPCGLHKAKAGYVKAFMTFFVNEWDNTVPADADELVKCPGIGRKIANLIVGEIYGIPAIVVDTHMKRVMNRIGLTDSDSPTVIERDLCSLFPQDSWIKLGHMAVDLGRMFCGARDPKCEACPLNSVCRRRM